MHAKFLDSPEDINPERVPDLNSSNNLQKQQNFFRKLKISTEE